MKSLSCISALKALSTALPENSISDSLVLTKQIDEKPGTIPSTSSKKVSSDSLVDLKNRFAINYKNVVRFYTAYSFSKRCLDCTLLRNGPHQVSMLHIKSLELTLSKGELAILKSFDENFRKGWLYNEIINSYLWGLCRKYSHCLFVSSSYCSSTTTKRLDKEVVEWYESIQQKTHLYAMESVGHALDPASC